MGSILTDKNHLFHNIPSNVSDVKAKKPSLQLDLSNLHNKSDVDISCNSIKYDKGHKEKLYENEENAKHNVKGVQKQKQKYASLTENINKSKEEKKKKSLVKNLIEKCFPICSKKKK